jgi:hypothetical protein
MLWWHIHHIISLSISLSLSLSLSPYDLEGVFCPQILEWVRLRKSITSTFLRYTGSRVWGTVREEGEGQSTEMSGQTLSRCTAVQREVQKRWADVAHVLGNSPAWDEVANKPGASLIFTGSEPLCLQQNVQEWVNTTEMRSPVSHPHFEVSAQNVRALRISLAPLKSLLQ